MLNNLTNTLNHYFKLLGLLDLGEISWRILLTLNRLRQPCLRKHTPGTRQSRGINRKTKILAEDNRKDSIQQFILDSSLILKTVITART